VIHTYGMNDVGKRIDHLMALQDLWSTALCILTTGTYHTEEERLQVQEIEIALRLLANHMQNDYDQTGYAIVINSLPRNPEDIPKEKP